MEYNIIKAGTPNINEQFEKLLKITFNDYDKLLEKFTKQEFDELIRYDILRIAATYYGQMDNAYQKKIVGAYEKYFELEKLTGFFDKEYDESLDEELYIPQSIALIEKLRDSKYIKLVYEAIFFTSTKLIKSICESTDVYGNALLMINATYFTALAYTVHANFEYREDFKVLYDCENFDKFLDGLKASSASPESLNFNIEEQREFVKKYKFNIAPTSFNRSFSINKIKEVNNLPYNDDYLDLIEIDEFEDDDLEELVELEDDDLDEIIEDDGEEDNDFDEDDVILGDDFDEDEDNLEENFDSEDSSLSGEKEQKSHEKDEFINLRINNVPEFILRKSHLTIIKQRKVNGFTCYFTMKKDETDIYVLIFQADDVLSSITDDSEEWTNLNHSIYQVAYSLRREYSSIYMIYIIDEDAFNIPIQAIEANRVNGRKYVFRPESAITFINGVQQTVGIQDNENIDPVRTWGKILEAVHLTGCLTETYLKRNVENYLSGDRFDSHYLIDEDYKKMSVSKVPLIKWVKSLSSSDFREFCFDGMKMDFGQINLFYGANGSGKTSVLEAIEFALTGEIRRIKDFNKKMDVLRHVPTVYVYNREAGVERFTPRDSAKNSKEIERVWYGVPSGRNKTTLNQNFGRFNAFDSEAAYKFIHESDNTDSSFAVMFGNLLFGDDVVDYEKKWTRYKKAFEESFDDIRENLDNARTMKRIYEDSLKHADRTNHSGEIEQILPKTFYKKLEEIPKKGIERYKKIQSDFELTGKYCRVLNRYEQNEDKLGNILKHVEQVKLDNADIESKKAKSNEAIQLFMSKIQGVKTHSFENDKAISAIENGATLLKNKSEEWEDVKRILSDQKSIAMLSELLEEQEHINNLLKLLNTIERYPKVVNFLKMPSFDNLSEEDYEKYSEELDSLTSKKKDLELEYTLKKARFSSEEQNYIELRKIGQQLIHDEKCPLCGTKQKSKDALLELIQNATAQTSEKDGMDALIEEIQTLEHKIADISHKLSQDDLVAEAKSTIYKIADDLILIKDYFTDDDYSSLAKLLDEKKDLVKKEIEIKAQIQVLNSQGFSEKNISYCKDFEENDSVYKSFKESNEKSFEAYITKLMADNESQRRKLEDTKDKLSQEIIDLEHNIEIEKNNISQYDLQLETSNLDKLNDILQSIEMVKEAFDLNNEISLKEWLLVYNSASDKIDLEVERLERASMVEFEEQQLRDYTAAVNRLTPQLERCSKAVAAFEKMPSLSSFVEGKIKDNISNISTFFTQMHHSDDFRELGVDEEGIYAIRGINDSMARTYEMSTGQRATIAFATMLSLYIAADTAPRFLLLDEPLATMDKDQVRHVLKMLADFAKGGTQIFFTTANGEMIAEFKNAFSKTDFDYKEYEFQKRSNTSVRIIEHSINDVPTIEDLSRDDIILDFSQMEEIRNILTRNQKKLLSTEELEEMHSLAQDNNNLNDAPTADNISSFKQMLIGDELNVLNAVLEATTVSSDKLEALASAYNIQEIVDGINSKAVDFYGETIIDDNNDTPVIYEDYLQDIKSLLK
ncbi:DNA repair exonuclease SbcCD ATPase subunit [Pseudobutyrivibrio sp. OR37]|uniref:AAA family ATPase n=1 Tax=Pseudobutyrivibrio sp. OR37 TaxID=1798186 RepID=UPI0008EEDDCE|nr:AAA family ATPase [Pseudobutyrivibrio sp. OR37]SFH57952.1 DNA repair exonuclease SbcCD ATPase subunit [Pseudobutyrivibrio sp. OR37]